MRVKVGNTVYDGRSEPVMVILNEKDKQTISQMGPIFTKYAEFPDGMDVTDARKFMEVDDCKFVEESE